MMREKYNGWYPIKDLSIKGKICEINKLAIVISQYYPFNYILIINIKDKLVFYHFYEFLSIHFSTHFLLYFYSFKLYKISTTRLLSFSLVYLNVQTHNVSNLLLESNRNKIYMVRLILLLDNLGYLSNINKNQPYKSAYN
jgi:hypothetical protein